MWVATGSHRSIASGARICSRVDSVNGLQEELEGQQAASEEVREQFKALVYYPGNDAVTVWSRSSLSNGHWMQQPQRICYRVFDQVEPTRSPWPRLFRPSTPSMPEDVDARVNLRTSGMRVIVKRAPPEDAR